MAFSCGIFPIPRIMFVTHSCALFLLSVSADDNAGHYQPFARAVWINGLDLAQPLVASFVNVRDVFVVRNLRTHAHAKKRLNKTQELNARRRMISSPEAKRLECDEDKGRFKVKLGKIARAAIKRAIGKMS